MNCEERGLNSGLPHVVLVALLEHGVGDENVESKVVVGGLGKMASSMSVPSRGPGLCAPVIRDSVSQCVRDRV